MCFINLCRLFTTQPFDFPGSNLLYIQQPAQLTKSMTSLKTGQWVSTRYRIKSPTFEFSKSVLTYWCGHSCLGLHLRYTILCFAHAVPIASTILSHCIPVFFAHLTVTCPWRVWSDTPSGSFPWISLHWSPLSQAGLCAHPLGSHSLPCFLLSGHWSCWVVITD